MQLDKYTDASDGVPEKVDDVKGYIDDNLDAVNQAMVGFFVVIGFFAIFGMVLFLRTRCLTNAGVDVNEHHCCVTCSRKILCILLTFIMFLTFVCAGILMGVAALSSDFCMKPSANIIEELDVSQHQERTKMHPECTTSAPRVHQECTQSAPRVHQDCNKSTHRVHQ